MPTENLAYLAGIIDGEGCITLWLKRQSGRHLCRVSITNKDEGILSACREILRNINIFFCEYPHSTKGCFIIEINRALEAKKLLELLMPYMKSYKNKKKAIDFIQYIEANPYDKLGRKIGWRQRKRGQ